MRPWRKFIKFGGVQLACSVCQTKMNFKNTTGLKLGNTAFKGGQTGRTVTMKTSKKAILNFRQLKL